MNFKDKAKINWLSFSEGGRKEIPYGGKYSTVAKFKENKDWPDKAWSVVLKCSKKPYQSLTTIMNIKFLVDKAPQKLLQKGSKFTLYKGKKIVASGVVI